MVNEAKTPIKVRYYRFKNHLKEKTVGLGLDPGVLIDIDPAALARAQAALEDMIEDYPDWVKTLLLKLSEEHRRAVDTPHERRLQFEKIRRIAHDMKGQGGTFNYPLITDFADSLYNFTGVTAGMTDSHIEIIKVHIDSMRVVINERLQGDGGQGGQALKIGLQQAIDKHTKVR
ncbi:hypothetical protein [Govanella unica]|uniref:HPt domain-containing protein n=1 Tax=Govanella unica TaxID=2975056 RepID=A0A9X3TWU0_9PROT|nr:hypothetical protein [Govania unica]MDA5193196.1 hypothetical protein [Govania unica]